MPKETKNKNNNIIDGYTTLKRTLIALIQTLKIELIHYGLNIRENLRSNILYVYSLSDLYDRINLKKNLLNYQKKIFFVKKSIKKKENIENKDNYKSIYKRSSFKQIEKIAPIKGKKCRNQF